MTILSTFGSGSSGVDTGDIGHSLRCRSAASAYLSRTFGTPTSNTSWALSVRIKKAKNGATQIIIGRDYSAIGFNASDQLTFWDSGGGQVATSTAVFRDPTSHCDMFFRSNGTNVKGYVIENGVSVEVISYSTTLPQLNSAALHNLARYQILGNSYLEGYLSRIAFVDNGGALTQADFGYLNTEINEWVSKSQSAVKAVVDAGGTNSFMLDFDNATSTTTLGYDKSSNGNNWTLNNFSLTAGTTYDHMLDVPGNSYATLNPLAAAASANLSSANLTNVTNATGYGRVHGSFAMSSGKWYWEATVSQMSTTTAAAGIATQFVDTYVGGASGDVQVVGATAVNQVLAIALDLDANTVAGYIDNVLAYGPSSIPAGSYFPAFSDSHNTVNYCTFNANFGQAPLHASAAWRSDAGGYFRYTPPTGFKALCQRNLPDPVILNPEKHFDVVTRAGTSAAATISSLSMQADLIWIKARTLGAGGNHVIADSVRGIGSSATKELYPNLTNAESGSTNVVTAFSSNGYSLGTDGAYDRFNATGHTYVDWLWKMGGAAVTNTKGSISSQVSANVLAGQSVVTYTGNNVSGHTVGHGLSSSPKLVIIKSRGNTEPWPVYHASAGFGNQLFLNTTAAQVAPANGYVGVVSSTTFSVNGAATNSNVNSLGVQYVALCFHSVPGYSKVGSYTGNGSADGPYVECGFKPKFVLIKRTDGVNQWEIFDTTRDTYNQMQNIMIPSSSAAETSGYFFDATAGGFKPRAGAGYGFNDSGAAYIFYAVADVAGKFALGR